MILAFLQTKNNKLSNKLQKDIIKIGGKTIFLNPFLYWRRIDQNTNRWLREPGQITELQIKTNRNRFYPEADWESLNNDQKALKDGTIEMFLKTLDQHRKGFGILVRWSKGEDINAACGQLAVNNQ